MRPTTKFDKIEDYKNQNLCRIMNLNNIDRSNVRDYEISYNPQNNQYVCAYLYHYQRNGKKVHDIRQKSFGTIEELKNYLGDTDIDLHYSEVEALLVQLDGLIKKNNNLVFRERKQ